METCTVNKDIGDKGCQATAGQVFNIIDKSAKFYTVEDPATGKRYAITRTDVTLNEDTETAILDELLGSLPKVPKKPKKPKEKVVLQANQIWFSSLTDGQLPKSKLDHVINVYPEDHFPEDIRSDIPEGNTLFKWDVEVLEMLVLAHKLNKKCLLTGLPGTGKSTSIKQFASVIRQPYMRFNGKDGIEPQSFLGYPWAVGGGKMEWKDGLLPIGVLAGYLVTIDEVFKLPAGIQMAMQALYEQDGSLLLDEKPGTLADKHCQPHNDFRMFLTDNVRGTGDDFSKFASTQVQDTSTLDRFAMMIEVEYLKVADEVGLLLSMYPEADQPTLVKLVKFAGLVRNGYRNDSIAVTLSPRGLFTICELMEEGIPVKTAIELAFKNKVAEDSERSAIDSMLVTTGL